MTCVQVLLWYLLQTYQNSQVVVKAEKTPTSSLLHQSETSSAGQVSLDRECLRDLWHARKVCALASGNGRKL